MSHFTLDRVRLGFEPWACHLAFGPFFLVVLFAVFVRYEHLHCPPRPPCLDRLLRAAAAGRARHASCAHARVTDVWAWICASPQEQKGRLKKSDIEYVILAGSPYSPLLSEQSGILGCSQTWVVADRAQSLTMVPRVVHKNEGKFDF